MSYKVKLLLLLVSVLSIKAFAQSDYKVHFGITGTFSGKLSFLDQDGKTTEHYKPLAAVQSTVALYIEDPNTLSFLLKLGVVYDYVEYLVNNNTGLQVSTEQQNLILNPEVLFPLSNQKFKLGAGIGLEYLLGKFLSLNGLSSTEIDKVYYYGNMDKKQRNLIPFINVNCWYELNPKVWFAIGIKQPLLSSYYKNETMDFDGTSFNLRHQPTYFSASVFYQIF
ncbi:hypothetical protein F0919_13930 [Taibaiella lutea]|uniref:Outer membrane protein beta-barrel domain-containing protein n=1 Tax=Taibaiella lutea TaxID=2608001 RepID=A0A5M6CET4_9BACT|nr:hypothetical protein [Taibaiella lutea]KAA5533631.1 hypothetical protein F0919_13930 [Taibaiella lutea]